nr:flavodoxin [uncultured Bacteroides sp.]
MSAIVSISLIACGNDEPEPEIPGGDNTEVPENSKILVAYFSWGGTTRRMAQQIAEQTGGTIFEIEPVVPYPTEYTPCTEVALEERDTDARPAIKNTVEDMESYDIVFIGCPVWWHTAPMIISTFTESYDLKGKIVVPFCTYASTYRDETLRKIVNLTPESTHLAGLGLTSGSVNSSNIATWLKNINVVKE